MTLDGTAARRLDAATIGHYGAANKTAQLKTLEIRKLKFKPTRRYSPVHSLTADVEDPEEAPLGHNIYSNSEKPDGADRTRDLTPHSISG